MSQKDTKKEEKNEGVMSARKKVRQSVSATTSVLTPPLPTVDTAFIPATSSAEIYPMEYPHIETGLYSSASTFPATSTRTEDTILYSRVPVLGELNSVTSQVPDERSLDELNDDSIWLFNVLNNIGFNDGYRKICQEGAITNDVIITFVKWIATIYKTGSRSKGTDIPEMVSVYRVGSRSEGTVIPDGNTDLDQIHCYERFPVIEDISKAGKYQISLLVVADSDTPAGYVKLQLVVYTLPCHIAHLTILMDYPSAFGTDVNRYFKPDKFERIVLFGIINESEENIHGLIRSENKPAAKLDGISDMVGCYRCKTWPTMAQEWLTRHRSNGWPSNEIIDELKSLGFFVVRKVYPFSSEIDLEWRISLTLQERKLISNLTDVQYKCYVILKMVNRDVINLDCITTYHWKTCLFYTLEENKATVWENNLLFHCVKLCIKRMLIWVKCGFCPDYFIPMENLFDGRMDDSSKLVSEKKLTELLNLGFSFLADIKSNNLCDYIRSRGSFQWTQRLQTESTKVFKDAVYSLKVETLQSAMLSVSVIIDQYRADENDLNFIQFLWQTLNYIQNLDAVSDHTPQETRRALSILEPFFHTWLASNISAMCIQQLNSQVRDFLLLGCYTLFIKGDLSGRFKFISVLYAVCCYKDCEWFLNKLDEEYMKNNPFVCICHFIPRKMNLVDADILEISELQMSTCVLFLPTERPIIPDVLNFEVFRHMGMSSLEHNKKDHRWCWHYWAVIDSNIYYFFLKILINSQKKAQLIYE